jgi:signal transduction histidine kinase
MTVEPFPHLGRAATGSILSCGTWDLDPFQERVRYEPPFKQLLGFAHEADYDHTATWRSRVHPDDLLPMKEALFAHIEGRTATYTMQFRIRAGGGDYRWVLSCGQAVERDRHGRALRVMGTLTDLSAVREQALRAAQAELRSRAGHELRTPLNAVLGFAQLMAAQLGQADIEAQRRQLAQIEQGGWQVLGQVDRLLAPTPCADQAAVAAAPPLRSSSA